MAISARPAFLPVLLVAIAQVLASHPGAGANQVRLGVEVLRDAPPDWIRGRRVGLITNASGVDSRLRSTAESLHEDPAIDLCALYAPEHGIRAAAAAGADVAHQRDPLTGLPVFSLYGATRRPTPEMLEPIDIMLIDIQDIGLRPYTYISTMAEAMEACRDAGRPFVVLDRPNPLGGQVLEGPVLDPAYRSFVGIHPIPYRHGMTIGELARLFNEAFGIGCELRVVAMTGWRRDVLWDDTGLIWVPTSPHVPHAGTLLPMASTGTLGELQFLSEGVGCALPFEVVGAAWIDPPALAAELRQRELPGASFRPVWFRPRYGPFADTDCGGVQIHVTDPAGYRSFTTGLHLLHAVRKLYPDRDPFTDNPRLDMFRKVVGTDRIDRGLAAGRDPDALEAEWLPELDRFRELRRPFLLYE